jgi:hypothetical protein
VICCFVGRRTSTQNGDGLNNTHTVKTELPSNFAAGRLPTCICLPRECGSRVSEQHPYGPIPESILQTVNSIAAEAPARGRGTRHRNRPVKQPNQCFLSFSTDLQTHTSAYTQLIPCPMPYFRKKKKHRRKRRLAVHNPLASPKAKGDHTQNDVFITQIIIYILRAQTLKW